MELSDLDRKYLSAQMSIQAYLQAQMQQIEKDIFLLLLMNYGADIRKADWKLDLEKGVLERVSTTTEQPE